MKISTCSILDLDKLREISIETFSDTFSEQNEAKNLAEYLKNAYQKPKLAEEMSNPDSFFFFLRNDDQHVTGYLKLNINSAQTEKIVDNALEIERIYIRKPYLRNGYGKNLLNFAIEFAQNHIWLGVWEENHNALAFYKKMGFKQVTTHDFILGNEKQTDLIMLKNVGR